MFKNLLQQLFGTNRSRNITIVVGLNYTYSIVMILSLVTLGNMVANERLDVQQLYNRFGSLDNSGVARIVVRRTGDSRAGREKGAGKGGQDCINHRNDGSVL